MSLYVAAGDGDGAAVCAAAAPRALSKATRGLPACAKRLAGAAVLAGGLTGCQSLNTNAAQLRVIDASPDAPGIDAYQNGTALAYHLDFGEMTSYVAMTPGAYTLAADRSGTRQTLTTGSASLMPGRQYTAIVGNISANLQQTLLLDQAVPAEAGKIAIRFVNEATRSGPVDVYLVPHSGHLMLNPPLTTALGFGTNSGYLLVPAGTYAIHVVPAGTVPVSTTVTLMTGPQIEYSSGAVRTVVLIDHELLGTHASGLVPGVQAIVANDADGP
jgi:hypothetical protein